MLVILSPHSAGSENVQDEIGLAFDKKKPIIPILSMPCDIPMRLRRLEYVDFTKQYDQAFQTLLTGMKLPTEAPSDSTTTERPAPAGSRPEHPGAPQRAVTSRRNLFIALGAVVVIIFLLRWTYSPTDQDTDQPDGDSLAAPSLVVAATHQSAAVPSDEDADEQWPLRSSPT